MNMFNRVALLLVCGLLIIGAGAIIGLTWAAPQESIDWLADASGWLDDHNTDGTKALITLGAGIAILLALVVLVAELLPRGTGEVSVTGLQGGDAVLTTAAIGQRIEEAVNQVPNVSDVRATVKAKGKAVLVGLDLHVDPDANLAEVTDAACQAARNVLQDRVHVELAAPPRARLHYRELRLKGRQVRPASTDRPPAYEVEPSTSSMPPSTSMPPPSSAPVVREEEKPVQA
jgi:hypothetical protein